MAYYVFIWPLVFALSYFSKRLYQFTAQYKDIELDIVVYDKVIDPISSGFDIVFQMFPPKGESLIERKIFNVNRVMCASPEFIEKTWPTQKTHTNFSSLN